LKTRKAILKIGDKCPDYIYAYCDNSAHNCTQCEHITNGKICQVLKGCICEHCPTDIIMCFKDEFRDLIKLIIVEKL